MRFLITIWRIQAPERLIAARERRAARARQQAEDERRLRALTGAPQLTASPSGEQAPTMTTTATATTPQTQESVEGEATFSGQYIRFYILLGVGAVVFVQAQSLPRWLSQPVVALIMLTAHSFWMPQIVRNVKRGSRRALDNLYVIGMTLSRLYLPLCKLNRMIAIVFWSQRTDNTPPCSPKDAFACPDNILGQRMQSWIWLVVLWLALQVLVLFLQDTLGPRFFISERYMPKPYNYHPVLQASDEENPATLLGDCAICMTPLIDKAAREDLNSASAAAGARRTASAFLGKNLELMQAPCGHTYHTSCLQQWMGVRLQCPLCKAPLPPDN